MSNTFGLRVSKLEFGSLLSYSPIVKSEPEEKAKNVMRLLKNDEVLSNPQAPISEIISRQIKANRRILPFAEFFKANPILVPVPKSSLMKQGALWVPQRIANAMVRNGLGKAVAECLQRNQAVAKAVTSPPENRPTALQHYNSLGVQKILSEPREILLIDDVITRGATILGAANRLKDVFPGSRIRAIAAMRTMSPPLQFNRLFDPRIGEIIMDGHFTRRRP